MGKKQVENSTFKGKKKNWKLKMVEQLNNLEIGGDLIFLKFENSNFFFLNCTTHTRVSLNFSTLSRITRQIEQAKRACENRFEAI